MASDLGAAARIASLSEATWGLAALGAAVEAGVIEALRDGPATAESVAERTGVPAGAVVRLLDVLASAGLIDRDAEGGFRLADGMPDATPLQADVRSTLLQTSAMVASA